MYTFFSTPYSYPRNIACLRVPRRNYYPIINFIANVLTPASTEGVVATKERKKKKTLTHTHIERTPNSVSTLREGEICKQTGEIET